jgi:hypothetical protein
MGRKRRNKKKCGSECYICRRRGKRQAEEKSVMQTRGDKENSKIKYDRGKKMETAK